MNIKKHKILTSDRKNLNVTSYLPDNYKRIMLIIHGIGEHAGRFDRLTEFLYNHQNAVIIPDLRGHGESDGVRGYAKKYQHFYFDIDATLNFIKQQIEYFPLFIYGHGFGAALLVNYATQQPLSVHGMIIASPWFKLAHQPNPIKLLLSRLFRLIPVATMRTNIDTAYYSRNKEVVNFIETDKLSHQLLTNKLFLQIVQQGHIASRSIYRINVPILVMHGTSDQIMDFKQSIEFVRNANTYTTTFKSWEGYYHELHNDVDNNLVFEYLNRWLNKLT